VDRWKDTITITSIIDIIIAEGDTMLWVCKYTSLYILLSYLNDPYSRVSYCFQKFHEDKHILSVLNVLMHCRRSVR
jgi:hypothetical protein